MEKVVEINFPVEFGKGALGEVTPSQFPRDTSFQELVVNLESGSTVPRRGERNLFGYFKCSIRTLFIDVGLFSVYIGYEKLISDFRVSGGYFVDAGSAVPEMLSGHKDGHLDIKLELNHFKRGCVPVSHEMSDESCICAFSRLFV